MTRAASALPRGSEFDSFLFSPISEDKNGMPLSVLSALARLDVDPWLEAATLARLPGGAAAQRLAALIAGLPNGPSGCLDSGLIAKRLVALLPRPASFTVVSSDKTPGNRAPLNSRAVLFMLFMALVLGTQFIIANRQAAAPVDGAAASVAGAVSGQMPTTTLDR